MAAKKRTARVAEVPQHQLDSDYLSHAQRLVFARAKRSAARAETAPAKKRAAKKSGAKRSRAKTAAPAVEAASE